MTFLTVFTAPKPFTNPHTATIQRNAIRSWMHLGDDVEVLLMGDEDGMAELSREYQIRHFPGVKCSQEGTPYINSMFEVARTESDAPFLAILNADIILMPDFVEAAKKVAAQVKDFLFLGRRWDLDIEQELEFNPGWEYRLQEEVDACGILHGPVGSDYFLLPRHLLHDMPEFTIGRSGWDNWTIYHAVESGWPVVDVTQSAMVIHQNHDYSHLPGNKPPYDLPETKKNIQIAGGVKRMYTILEANTILVDGSLKPAPVSLPRLLHRLELMVTTDDLHGPRKSLVRWLKRTRKQYENQL
ncbi:MAG: glycosyltransferase family A protein [Anaerolineales bacterium]